MTVEFRPENLSQTVTIFPDGKKLDKVSFFIDGLPKGTPTDPPFDSFKVGNRRVIAANIEVFPYGIVLRHTIKKGMPNPDQDLFCIHFITPHLKMMVCKQLLMRLAEVGFFQYANPDVYLQNQ